LASKAELELVDRATLRLRDLVNGGDLDLTLVRCSCPRDTQGTRLCSYGRACGVLTAKGKDVGMTLIAEGLARPYVCGHERCPKRQPWC
jgi:micrococcal nuclease